MEELIYLVFVSRIFKCNLPFLEHEVTCVMFASVNILDEKDLCEDHGASN